MSGSMTSGVSLSNMFDDDWTMPFNLAAATVVGNVGAAMSLDTSAGATAKLAVDDEEILGRLETFEDRVSEGTKIGTITMKGIFTFRSIATVPAIGAQVTGSATAGEVKTAVTPAVGRRAQVVARDATNRIVTVILN